MPQIVVVDQSGAERTVDAPTGRTLMEAIRDNGFDELLALCGGCCSCATCHVYVGDAFIGQLPPPDEMENELLDGVASDRLPGSRLGCQIVITPALDGLTVRIPESQV